MALPLKSRIDRGTLASLLCYALAIGLASGSNFLSVPLVLALVGPEGFARWALIEPLILALIPIAGFGINYGLMHAIAHGDPPRRAIGKLFPGYLAGSLVVSAAGGAVALAIWGWDIAWLCALVILAEGAVALFVTYWRSTDRPALFAAVEGGRAAAVVLLLAAAWLWMPTLISTLPGYLGLRGVIGIGAVLLGIAIVRPAGRGDWAEARAAVRFGLPIVCASVLVSLTSSLDRYAVAHFVSVGAVALYVAQIKLVQVLGSALAPFFTWFAPLAMKRLKEGEAAHPFFAKSVFAFQTVNACCTLGLWFLTPIVWPRLFGALPFDAPTFAVLLIGQMIYALGNPVSIGTLREGKTWQALRATLVTLAVMAAACLVLGALAGAQGVAWGRLIGLSAYTLILGLGTEIDLKVRFPWGSMALVTAIPVLAMAVTAGGLMRYGVLAHLGGAAGGCLLILGVAAALFAMSPAKRSATA